MKIPVGVSGRHIHLTKETYDKLFDEELSVRNMLTQPGQFASNQLLTVKTDKSLIENVRILGPFRSYDQVEISKTDAFKLGLNSPVRHSGDIEDSLGITLIGPKGEVVLDSGVIIAKRHIHFSKEEALCFNIINDQPLKVVFKGFRGDKNEALEESLIAFAKIQEPSYLELHIDTDEANALGLSQNDECEIIIEK